jgi:hypothetical protein
MFFGCGGLLGLFAFARFAFLLLATLSASLDFMFLQALVHLAFSFLVSIWRRLSSWCFFLQFDLQSKHLASEVSFFFQPSFSLRRTLQVLKSWVGFGPCSLFAAEFQSLSGFIGGGLRLLPGLLRAMIFVFRGVIVGVATFLVASLQGFLSLCTFADLYKFCGCSSGLWVETMIRH